MKVTFSILLIHFSLLIFGQSKITKLVVEKRTVYELQDVDVLEVDTLIMMDSSRLRLNQLKRDNTLRVKFAVIGKNCVVDGRGADGPTGRNGMNGRVGMGPCRDGTAARDGARGHSGRPGVNLYFYLEKIIVNGTLIIDLAGGNGGDGGNGGEGGGGSSGTVHCKGGDGGTGGDAGAGGDGGAGGTLMFGGADLEAMRAMLGSQIIVNTLGGNFGYSGIPGAGGAAGLGPSRKDGKDGIKGKDGVRGKPGINGGIQFEQQ
jgi:hypothetical protein